jgi:Family of unknown function (DUF5677)
VSELQREAAEKEERVSRVAVPRLNRLADDLLALARAAFGPRIPFDRHNAADLMVLGFTTKQCEHLRSVRLLMDASAHRDALLIARTMAEGLGMLLWATNNQPMQTDRWRDFGWILDWRRVARFERCGITLVDPADKALLKAKVDRCGPDFYRPSVRKEITAAACCGTTYNVPDDPWGTDWTDMSVEAMFREIRGTPMYEAVYRQSSEWVHWNPRAVVGAMQPTEWGIAGFTEEDWRDAHVAMQAACRSVLQSLEVLNLRFSLGLDERLTDLGTEMHTIQTESEAAGTATTG